MINLEIQNLLKKETDRLNNDIELIASENYPSQDILDLLGSQLSCKYAEGYINHRHYAGCEVIDKVEQLAIENACKLFGCNYANVQPWSGSQANQAVYLALCKPGDTLLGMDLSVGGHLTHGSKVSSSGKLYNAVSYGVDDNGFINYEDMEEKLYTYQPTVLIVGASAYSRQIDFKRIREFLDKYNNILQNAKDEGGDSLCVPYCYLMVDMAHIAGLVAAGVHPSPLPYADVVTSTTHKTLRGPRGGLILWNNDELTKKINSAVFPGIQGGPNEACVAAKCQCFIEAQQPSFKRYAKQVLNNMQALIDGIEEEDKEHKISFISGGSDNHVVLLNLKETGILGKEAEEKLTKYHIITNKNMIKGDTKPSLCTGLRLGTAAVTTRGFTEAMCYELGRIIVKILYLDENNLQDKSAINFEDNYIRIKLKEMLDKVGPFYKVDNDFIPNPQDIA